MLLLLQKVSFTEQVHTDGRHHKQLCMPTKLLYTNLTSEIYHAYFIIQVTQKVRKDPPSPNRTGLHRPLEPSNKTGKLHSRSFPMAAPCKPRISNTNGSQFRLYRLLDCSWLYALEVSDYLHKHHQTHVCCGQAWDGCCFLQWSCCDILSLPQAITRLMLHICIV